MSKIVLFDGECHFCDRSVQFIINHDPRGLFKFASLQSKVGQDLMTQHNIPLNITSFVLITDHQWYAKSTAALHVCKNLNGCWKMFSVLLIIPKPVRDYFYNFISNHRYQWFGRKKSCKIPTPEIRERFLE